MTVTTAPVALSDHGRIRRHALAIAALIAVADQVVKWLVRVPLSLERKGSVHIFDFFRLTWAENRGISLSMFEANSDLQRWLLVAVTALVATFVARWMWREANRIDAYALSMILGGAIGNIIDRTRFGYVVDYADFHIGSWRPFMIFNLADAAITIGVVILVARALLIRDKDDQQGYGDPPTGAGSQGDGV